MHVHLFNAWFLAVPILSAGIYVAVFHRDTVKRMADMTGYSQKEKALAVSASSTPHLFTLVAFFIPLSSNTIAVAVGATAYAIGLIGFLSALSTYIKTPPGTLATRGMYRISRNPMYVTALLSFAGITIITLNVLPAIILCVMVILHHMMIRSEEKACAERFGKQYEQYKGNTPRYLFL